MMEALIRRAQAIARTQQLAKVREVAAQLSALLGDAAVEIEDARVLVRGRGLIKRWLIDPALRFFSGVLK